MSTSVAATGSITRLPSTATAAQIKEITDRDGGVIVEQVLTPDLLARINSELDPYVAGMDPATFYGDSMPEFAQSMGTKTKRLEGLVQKSDAVVEAVLDERFQEWGTSCLDWAGEIQLNAIQLIQIGPGEGGQGLHRDESTFAQVADGPHELVVSCMLALSDFTEEVGATRVAPGSHLDNTIDLYSPDAEPVPTVPAVMKAGDALFFTGKVVHGGGANTTEDRSRRGMTMTLSLGWLKPEEAHTLSVTHERAQELPPRMRELCSFAGYRPYPGVNLFSHRVEMADAYTVYFGEERPKS
jgi:hypothetical protein